METVKPLSIAVSQEANTLRLNLYGDCKAFVHCCLTRSKNAEAVSMETVK
jgi:hypothetical protein